MKTFAVRLTQPQFHCANNSLPYLDNRLRTLPRCLSTELLRLETADICMWKCCGTVAKFNGGGNVNKISRLDADTA